MADQENTIGITNPHDKLFRETYSDLNNARSFLTNYLPDNALKAVDLNSLEICKDSFIEKELSDYYSDMLYKVNLTGGNPGFIYVLFEHKSYYDRYVHLQLLEYMIKIWRLHIKQHKKKSPSLPIVIPLLICHGNREWPENTRRLTALMTGPVKDLAAYIPDFEFELYDLSLLSKEIGLQYLEMIFRYLLSVLEKEQLSFKMIKEMADVAISKKAGDHIMTIAEELRKEGEIKGKLEGLRDAIDLGMTLKFPDDINVVMVGVKEISDIDTLVKIKEAIKTAKDSSEILVLIK